MSSAWLRAGVRTTRTARTATPANFSATKPMAHSCLAEFRSNSQVTTVDPRVRLSRAPDASAPSNVGRSVQDAVENVVHAELVRLVRRVDGKHAGRRPLPV